jgi:concentrative nucleoside transporter, CNT family
MERFSALIGFVLILAIAFALSNNKGSIRWKTVGWGLLLQILIAIAVLKGEPISRAIVGPNPPITQMMASLIFIAVAVVVYLIARKLASAKGLWIGFAVFSLALFVTFNLLAFLFENLKEVVNHLIGYTQEGSKFVFGALGDPANKSIGFVFATQVLPSSSSPRSSPCSITSA